MIALMISVLILFAFILIRVVNLKWATLVLVMVGYVVSQQVHTIGLAWTRLGYLHTDVVTMLIVL
jgi:hypothetical protein